MRSNGFRAVLWIFGVAAAAAVVGCQKQETAPPPAPAAEAAKAPTPANVGKIPITTSSADAKTEFLKARDLFEKLLGTDSIPHFEKAVALDPNFATAELNLALVQPTAKGFFEHLGKAVSLADKVSDGEKLQIQAADAGSKNDLVKQQQLLEQLVEAYPEDERAHFALGTFLFGQQDFSKAIEHLRKATEIAPNYSIAYNLLGYGYRQLGDFGSAEKSFQRYIELIPNDPNPYDSYAELLLRMGRYDDSIAQYRKALSIDSNFLNAHQGIAMDLLYQGKPAEAAAELAQFTKKARNDGEQRTALFALTVVHADDGQMAKAIVDLDAQYALGAKINDSLAMAFDCQLKGNVYLAMGKPDLAAKEYDKTLKLTLDGATVSPELKDNAKFFDHYNRARVAVAKKDLTTARAEADEFRKEAATVKNPLQVTMTHEIDGIIALAEKNYDKAIAELSQANQQNPQNLYRQFEAYSGKGDGAKAKEFCMRAADFNSLPNLNYALIRTKAKAAGGEKKA